MDQNKAELPTLRAIVAAKPDLMVFTGDSIYSTNDKWSSPSEVSRTMSEGYTALGKNADFDELRKKIPLLMSIWDDNDYGVADGGEDFKYKAESKKAFLNFWNEPEDSDRTSRGGLYTSRILGIDKRRLQVILLDTRWFRSKLKSTVPSGRSPYVPDADPSKTMLGDEQWKWLEAELRKPADVRLLVSSIQVLDNAAGFECWDNLPLEKARLIRVIKESGAKGVILISGDRHVGGLYCDEKAVGYPLYEVLSSGLARVAPSNSDTKALMLKGRDMVKSLHFGQIDLDWQTRRVTLSLRGATGQIEGNNELSFDFSHIGSK